MAFDLFELSRWLGKPIHLFTASCGPLVWRFASSDRPISIGGDTYLPAPISRTALRESVESRKNNVTITMPYLLDPEGAEPPVTQSFGDLFRPWPPGRTVEVACLALHYGDDDVDVEWTGRVLAPRFTDTQLKIECEPSHTSARKSGLQLKWQRGCPLTVYSQGVGMCNVDPVEFAVQATLANVSGLTLTANTFADLPTSRLAGGFIEWTRPDGLQDFRSILAHTGSSIVVNYGAADFANGLQLIAYPGCPGNWNACESFDNTPNYGGALYLQVRNPFGGSRVW
jgi:hypothetical protein